MSRTPNSTKMNASDWTIKGNESRATGQRRHQIETTGGEETGEKKVIFCTIAAKGLSLRTGPHGVAAARQELSPQGMACLQTRSSIVWSS